MEELDSGTVFRDRSVGLLLFGVLEILIGVVVAAVVPLLLVAASRVGIEGQAAGRGATAAMVALHVVVGAGMVLLGVGSIRARRWARVVWISVSWIWLLTGAMSLVISVLMLPSLLQVAGIGSLSRTAGLVVGTLVLVPLAAVYVVLPAVLLLFYRSPHVAATCRERGPHHQWTDGVPQQVVTLVILWLAASASVAVMPAYNWIMPFFGALPTGSAGAVAWAAVALLCAVLAVGSARRRPWALTAGLVLAGAGTLSAVVTSAVVEPSAMVAAMQLPAEQQALMSGLENVGRWPVMLFWLIVGGSFVLYLMRLRPVFSDD